MLTTVNCLRVKNIINFKNSGRDISLEFLITNAYPDTLRLVIAHKDDHKIISATGFNEKSEFEIGVYEIGYWIDSYYQGQGFVTEFVTAITRFAFDYLNAMRVQIVTQVENERSVSVAKRCSFDFEATLKNHRIDCLSGKPADSYVFVKTDSLGLSDLKIKVEWVEK